MSYLQTGVAVAAVAGLAFLGLKNGMAGMGGGGSIQPPTVITLPAQARWIPLNQQQGNLASAPKGSNRLSTTAPPISDTVFAQPASSFPL